MFHTGVAVQFYPWFKLYFPLFQFYHETLSFTKTKDILFQTKDKTEPLCKHGLNLRILSLAISINCGANNF